MSASTLLQQMGDKTVCQRIMKAGGAQAHDIFWRSGCRLQARTTQQPDLKFCTEMQKKSTKAADRNCDRIVAMAAPRMPSPITKIKTGSRIRWRWRRALQSIPIGRVALRIDEWIHARGNHGRKGAKQIDHQVRIGIGECVCGCTEQSQDRTAKISPASIRDNRGQR